MFKSIKFSSTSSFSKFPMGNLAQWEGMWTLTLLGVALHRDIINNRWVIECGTHTLLNYYVK